MLVPIPRLTEVVPYLRGSSRVSNTPRQRNIDISHINVVTWWVGYKIVANILSSSPAPKSCCNTQCDEEGTPCKKP